MRKGKVAEVGTQEDLKNDLKMRIGAGSVVIAVFFGLGFVKRTDLFGLGALIDSETAFFAAAFGTIGAVWMLYLLYFFYIE